MPVAFRVGLWSALAMSAVACASDWRQGTIPNWLTVPPLVVFPIFYGALLGPNVAALSVFSLFASALVPYWLFRLGGMGGGDVKLFAALGAATGFDPTVGIRVELGAFVAATLMAVVQLSRRGELLATLRGSRLAAIRILGLQRVRGVAPEGPSIRLGSPIFVATCISCIPLLSFSWSIR